MTLRTITVPDSIPFPARQLPGVLQNLLGMPASQSHWLIENGCVRINERLCRKLHQRVEPGDQIEVDWIPMPVVVRTEARSASRQGPVEFLHDDPHLCVVVKPPNLLTVPTMYREGQTLVSKVERRLRDKDDQAKIFCVHRLDRDVSGVLVLAKTLQVAELLREQFAARKPDRQYIAIVAGVPQKGSGTIRSYLATDANLNRYSVKGPVKENSPESRDGVGGRDRSGGHEKSGGREKSGRDRAGGREKAGSREGGEYTGELAITHYKLRHDWGETALVEVRLETGRRNQIRVHLAEMGHPILGDPRYRPDLATHRAWPYRRIALHAESLGFTHPITGEQVRFLAPWPQEFRDFQRAVSKPGGAKGKSSKRDTFEP